MFSVDRFCFFAFALCAAIIVMPEPAAAKSPLTGLAGTWGGSGSVRMADGRRERIRCRAYYNKRGGGGVGMAIRCAAPGYRIELRSNLRYSNGRVSGNWRETNFNASGSISGRARPGRLAVAIRGGISGSMSVSFSKRRQRISISTSTGNLRGVSISLGR